MEISKLRYKTRTLTRIKYQNLDIKLVFDHYKISKLRYKTRTLTRIKYQNLDIKLVP